MKPKNEDSPFDYVMPYPKSHKSHKSHSTKTKKALTPRPTPVIGSCVNDAASYYEDRVVDNRKMWRGDMFTGLIKFLLDGKE